MAVDDEPKASGTHRRLAGPLARSSWFMRWLIGAPARWLGKESGVSQNIIGGTTDGLSYLRHLARGNRVVRQSEFTPTQNIVAPPVLLIHGFLGTRGSMYLLERRLLEDGFVVVSFNIGALNSRDIRRSAFMIYRKIERILEHSPGQKIDIIGHSMGGLIGLYLVKKLGGHARVRRLVMMGTPVRGTWIALAGIATLGLWSTSSWQLLPRSRFLDELAQGPLPPETEVYTLAAARDWVVPHSTTRVVGATAVTVPLGHSSLVVAEDVYRRLVAILRPPVLAEDGATTAAEPQNTDENPTEGVLVQPMHEPSAP